MGKKNCKWLTSRTVPDQKRDIDLFSTIDNHPSGLSLAYQPEICCPATTTTPPRAYNDDANYIDDRTLSRFQHWLHPFLHIDDNSNTDADSVWIKTRSELFDQ